MTTINFLEDDELGFGVTKGSDHKLTVKLDNTGNVKFTKSEDGLKGEVTLPTTELPTSIVTEVTLDEEQGLLSIDHASGETVLYTIPRNNVDVKVAGLTFTDDGKLKATLSDNTEVETEFNAEIVIAAIEGASDAQKVRLVNALKPQLLAALKGEEIQNFSGETKGFLLSAN